MLPILACSVVALAFTIERCWALRRSRVVPKHLVAQVWHLVKSNTLEPTQLRELRAGSPLGRMLAAGLVNIQYGREIVLESIEDRGRHEAHGLERYLNTLGTIAAVSPLLGLLGTVIGMIKVFSSISSAGLGNVTALAGGISQALFTTAAGLVVAIPTLMAYRYFRGKVETLVVDLEQESLKLVEVIHARRGQAGNAESQP
ncbi:MotA/TolQ/ExbB proton channel [Nitrococcus mobilis Nb-231]|uniref:MotA/TolQ/ExbB proton channel n=2 Tax=Nitrococcus mobilis TaxID=35797 RepID=A4BMK6_9GAMM|nr:MotA/TolQ/ExbB proton channel [Nitrococcus mobilis Nb-231]